MIDIFVVEDHPTKRMGINLLLENTPDINLVGEAKSCIKALELAESLKPDFLMLDFRLPDMSGSEVSAEAQTRKLKPRMLRLSAYSDEDYIFKMMNAGALGLNLFPFIEQSENLTLIP